MSLERFCRLQEATMKNPPGPDLPPFDATNITETIERAPSPLTLASSSVRHSEAGIPMIASGVRAFATHAAISAC